MIERVLQFLISLLQRWQNRDSLKTLGAARSPKWGKVRAEFLKNNPKCAVCSKTKDVVPHHKIPFHIDKNLELQISNLVPLCESAGMNCHITFGHLSNFSSFNSDIEKDVVIWNTKVQKRP